ncbi:MAG: MoaD/ThiS family protein [Spirosomaceae bacterium]|nr:MoaD/ThiS family protein [Spirosomataceae bacterium]
MRIALNTEYAQDSDILKANDEIVLIPPVSGG